jgi:hypothetical protein
MKRKIQLWVKSMFVLIINVIKKCIIVWWLLANFQLELKLKIICLKNSFSTQRHKIVKLIY